MILILKQHGMRAMLKFCCFLVLIIAVGCGDKATKKEGAKLPDDKVFQAQTNTKKKVILFFGNSLTAGMGLDPNEAFPAIIQEMLDSLNLNYTAINAGLSGETTASGKNRVSWLLDQEIDVFVLELGANDGLRGIPLEETRSNLQSIIETVRQKNQNTIIVLAGMQIPPNMGQEYTKEFRNIFPELAQVNNLYLIPFLLQDVAAIPELNQPDGIHPTAEGQEILAQNVWKVLGTILLAEDPMTTD